MCCHGDREPKGCHDFLALETVFAQREHKQKDVQRDENICLLNDAAS